MTQKNTEWRYHYVESEDAVGIDFDKHGRNGFELCGLASHNGKLVAVFKRSPTVGDRVGRAARKAQRGAVARERAAGAGGTRGA